MYCQKCGAVLKEGAKFCDKCGTSIDGTDNFDISTKGRKVVQKSKKKKRGIIIAVCIILLLIITIGNMGKDAPEDFAEKEVESGKVSEITPAKEPVSHDELKQEEAATPLTDFWVIPNDNQTLAIRALETHNKKCVISSEYIIDSVAYKVTEIGDACFFGRTSLELVSIPEGVTEIAHNAFNGCAVKELYLPASLTNINTMFDYFGKSVDVYYAGTLDRWKQIANTGNVPENVSLYVETPVIELSDSKNYAMDELKTEKSQAEELGGSLGNALNGLISGFADGAAGD